MIAKRLIPKPRPRTWLITASTLSGLTPGFEAGWRKSQLATRALARSPTEVGWSGLVYSQRSTSSQRCWMVLRSGHSEQDWIKTAPEPRVHFWVVFFLYLLNIKHFYPVVLKGTFDMFLARSFVEAVCRNSSNLPCSIIHICTIDPYFQQVLNTHHSINKLVNAFQRSTGPMKTQNFLYIIAIMTFVIVNHW